MVTAPLAGHSRISCSVFFRFTTGSPSDGGKIVLHRAFKNDRPIMRPLGGSLRAGSMTTITQLQRSFGARGFDGGLDLRFLAPTDQVSEIEKWFRTGRGRERNTRPPLVRQLSGDLHVLSRADALELKPKFAYFARHAGESSNPTAKIKLTQYLIEVHTVEVSDRVMSQLVAASKGKIETRRLYFTDAAQIRDQSGPGGFISSLAKTLIERPIQNR